jgi:hypothetical protein
VVGIGCFAEERPAEPGSALAYAQGRFIAFSTPYLNSLTRGGGFLGKSYVPK